MKNNKYIIGGGISGLLYAAYNPDHTIISPDLGGRLNQKFFENIIYLHKTPLTQKLLDDFEVDYEHKTQMIKYAKGSKVTSHIDVDDKVSMIKKKLDDPDFNPSDLKLSTSDYYISVLVFDYGKFIDKIAQKVKHIDDKVIRITDDEIITEKTGYKFDELVSTIPAPLFWRLYHDDPGLKFDHKPVTFALTNKEPEWAEGIEYDMIYCIDDEQEYTRISKKPGTRDNPDFILYEFTGEYDESWVIDQLPDGAVIESHYVDKAGVIYTNMNNIPPKNVLFAGRFATWNHAHKQQDVLKKAMFDYDFRNVFHRQASFSRNFIDFNNLGDNDYTLEMMKVYILNLYSEVTEILNELPYRQHKDAPPVDYPALIEEAIDTFKYLLNIFIILGVDAEQFIQEFNRKSEIVEQEYARKQNEKNRKN